MSTSNDILFEKFMIAKMQEYKEYKWNYNKSFLEMKIFSIFFSFLNL